MKKNGFLILCILLVSMMLVSCENDDDVKMTQLNLSTVLSSELAGIELGDLNVEITSLTSSFSTTGITSTDGSLVIDLEEGIYTIKINGEKSYSAGENSNLTIFLRGLAENVSLQGDEVSQQIALVVSVPNSGWVFKELYFTGSKTPTGSTYYKD